MNSVALIWNAILATLSQSEDEAHQSSQTGGEEETTELVHEAIDLSNTEAMKLLRMANFGHDEEFTSGLMLSKDIALTGTEEAWIDSNLRNVSSVEVSAPMR